MDMKDFEIPTFAELTFNEERHIYCLNDAYIPAVSTVMKPLSQALYKDVDEEVLNRAAARGTAVHNAIENYVLYGIRDIAEQYQGYFRAFREWWDKEKPEALATECRVYHRILRYAGTADMPVILNGKKILVDFKTSASINKMLTGVQLEAYSRAYESHGYEFDGKAILHLQSNGEYQWMYYDRNDSESWEVFGALLTVYNHVQKYRWKR